MKTTRRVIYFKREDMVAKEDGGGNLNHKTSLP